MNVFIFCFGTHKSTFESVHHDKVNIMYLLLFNCSSKNKIKISFYVNFTNKCTLSKEPLYSHCLIKPAEISLSRNY